MPTDSRNGPRSLGRTGSKYLSARAQVLANNQICWLCGELIDLDLEWPHPMYGTADHIIEVKNLARDDPRLWDPKNLKPAHLSCNSRRSRTGTIKVAEHPTSRNWRE
jgi:5-methylcytosine-specific restriction endonuclease McrA